MGRVSIDCRDFQDGTGCTTAFSADTDEELIEVCVRHVIRVHGAEKDTPALRQEIMNGFKTDA